MFWHGLAVVVGGDLTMILLADFRTSETFCIITNGQHQLVSHQTFRYEVECHSFCHFPYYHTGLLESIWLL